MERGNKRNQNVYSPLIQQVADASSITIKAMTEGINRFVEKRNKKFCFYCEISFRCIIQSYQTGSWIFDLDNNSMK